MFSAIVLSARPVSLELPGVRVQGHVSRFRTAAQLLAARCAAIDACQTPYFFFVDDDDALPPDYLEVLQACAAADVGVAYTNEVLQRPDGTRLLLRRQAYDRAVYQQRYDLIHHLALCKTDVARQAIANVPRGTYGFEPLVYPEIARLAGAHWVDRTGYIWNRTGQGLSATPDVAHAMMRAAIWTNRRARA